jgi:hypothetical protein
MLKSYFYISVYQRSWELHLTVIWTSLFINQQHWHSAIKHTVNMGDVVSLILLKYCKIYGIWHTCEAQRCLGVIGRRRIIFCYIVILGFNEWFLEGLWSFVWLEKLVWETFFCSLKSHPTVLNVCVFIVLFIVFIVLYNVNVCVCFSFLLSRLPKTAPFLVAHGSVFHFYSYFK